MPPLTDTPKSLRKNTEPFVVLVLPNPPSPWNMIDWYWKKIAGVPFLLRNILSLQEAGVSHLVLFTENSAAKLNELFRRAETDPRLKLKLQCYSEPGPFLTCARENRHVLFLDGSTLQNKDTVASAIKPDIQKPNQETGQPLHLSTLEALMRHTNECGVLSWPEKFQCTDLPHQTSPQQNSSTTMDFLKKNENYKITQPEDFIEIGNRLIRSCGLSNDSFMDKLITRSISRQLTRQIIKTPLTPNLITLISLAIGLGSAVCFLSGSYGMGVVGGGLLLLSTWIDCTDGEVARLKFLESPLGKQMDIICDNLVHMAVFFSMGVGLQNATGNDLFIFLGGLAVLGCLISCVSLAPEIMKNKIQPDASKPVNGAPKSITDQLANRDFTYLLFFMALIAKLDIFLVLAAAGSNVFAGYVLYNRFKTAS
ncbi:MAG: hypothetical protein NPINA01_15280 [Nitrospinaceae bacterium]|nr:MAG: hypothetical protein NPINA01_15280 [Nitrospinaceae bacterium]